MAYLALFNNVIEDLNLLLMMFLYLWKQKFSYLAMALGSSLQYNTEFCLAIGGFHHIMQSTNPSCQELALSVTCMQLSISAETMGTADHFKLPSQYKT